MTIPVWLLIALPLAGAAMLLLGGRAHQRLGPPAGLRGRRSASFAVGAVLFADLLGRAARRPGDARDAVLLGAGRRACRWTSACNSTSCRCASCC